MLLPRSDKVVTMNVAALFHVDVPVFACHYGYTSLIRVDIQ